MADLATAYRKTDAGSEELTGRRLGLSREQRNLLIVADGRHPLSVYAKVVGKEGDELAGLADSLVGLGLLESAGRPPVHHRHEIAGAPSDGATLVRQLMELATTQFGGQAGPVLKKLEKAGTTVADLLAAVDSAAKLAKLTIDDVQAERFREEARKLLASR